MNRVMIILLISVLVAVAGCSTEEKDSVVAPDNEKPLEPNDEAVEENNVAPLPPPVFIADPSLFHFIADWITDSEILYVEKGNGVYQIKSFNFDTGASNLVYEDESFITDIMVHPSLDYLLVHTSDQSDFAIVKMVALDGTVQHQVEINSTELAIEWNDMDPEMIVFTAFHEDWSFDLFVFNGHTGNLSIIELDDPFPKWIGERQIANMLFAEHPLDGGEIIILHTDTGKINSLGVDNVIYFDSFEDRLLIVQSHQADNFSFSLRDYDGTIFAEWDMPAVSNYSEWVIPEVEWINRDRFLYKGALQSGQLDELASAFNLYLYEEGNSNLITEGLDAEPVACSPSGKRCLNGYTFEELLEVETGVRRKWIEFDK
ncbi:hypothetical protein [Sporosarcina highlanderae]|uniref:YqgU-like 6-bladed beta-propeller domain-containing protein n=1 Tax=Sporosarcina highlanderae TaxID=3035916 RepID=A0ABT8JV39_9BACL|nr:hypothetical protein [Sporosarcina highlanderae]MDN4609033.1 hypothetical protein [Sporosarcina highlanderae]